MQILIVCDSFYPKRNAPANRFLTLISYWAISHHVTLLTRDAYLNNSNFLKKYININNLNIISQNNYFKSQKIIFKFLNLFLFFYNSMKNLFLLKNKNYDIVLCTSPSLISLLVGYLAKLKFKSKYAVEIRDIWSDSLRDLGIIKSDLLYKFIKKYEDFFIVRADLLISVTNNIKNKLPHNFNHIVLTNFVSIDILKSNYYDKVRILNSKKTYKKINLLYIGTIGLSHEFEQIINLAKNNKDIVLSIVGDGVNKKNLNNKYSSYTNINFFNYSNDHKLISNFYLNSDVCLILLKNLEIFKSVIPSKIFEYTYLKKFILYYGPNNEASNLINEYKIGLCSHNTEELKSNIQLILNGYISKNYSKARFDEFNMKYSAETISKSYLNEIVSL